MIHWRFILFICLSVLQLNSCSIEEARNKKNRKLVVLSDYLEPQDSIIFKSFKRQQDIDIEIIHLSTDKMIGLTRNKKYTADADIIMVKSMYDVHRLSQQSILQQIVFTDELSDKQRKYFSTKLNYICMTHCALGLTAPPNRYCLKYISLLQFVHSYIRTY